MFLSLLSLSASEVNLVYGSPRAGMKSLWHVWSTPWRASATDRLPIGSQHRNPLQPSVWHWWNPLYDHQDQSIRYLFWCLHLKQLRVMDDFSLRFSGTCLKFCLSLRLASQYDLRSCTYSGSRWMHRYNASWRKEMGTMETGFLRFRRWQNHHGLLPRSSTDNTQ